MLQVLAGGLPFDSVQPAVHLLVKNLLATNTSKYQFTAEVINVSGQKATANNAIDSAIFVFGALINRDTDLANELASNRPALQKGLEFTGTHRDGKRSGLHYSFRGGPSCIAGESGSFTGCGSCLGDEGITSHWRATATNS